MWFEAEVRGLADVLLARRAMAIAGRSGMPNLMINDDAAAGSPRVCVLISTYNGEAFLAAQLDSLLAQQGVTVEVFARDDGSSAGLRTRVNQ